jgi:hypothetical protein
VLLFLLPFLSRQFMVWMTGQPWPKNGRLVSLTRVLTALRKALVRAHAQQVSTGTGEQGLFSRPCGTLATPNTRPQR